MESLLVADAVVTTFYFLQHSKVYAEVIDHALHGRLRSRAALASWSRACHRTEPVVEAVYWKRVIVDEWHDTIDTPRDLAHLRLLRARAVWGITATPPSLESERAQHLYFFLAREKSHHPNLLTALAPLVIVSHAKTSSVRDAHRTTHRLNMVRLSAEEVVHLTRTTVDAVSSAGDFVRRSAFVTQHDPRSDDGVEEQFHRSLDRERRTMRAKVEGYERSVRILERAGSELESEVARLVERCVDGDEAANAQVSIARDACEAHSRDLTAARNAWLAERRRAERFEESERSVQRRLRSLHRSDGACVACRVLPGVFLASPCAHVFCRGCATSYANESRGTPPACPFCGTATPNDDDWCEVGDVRGIGSKMRSIGTLLLSLAAHSVLLFVQWKSMVRGTRSFLKSIGLRALLLDGNTAQRAATLADFQSGGVLLLCLEECFAGLHLPHVSHVVFAHAIVADRERVRHLEEQAIARCVRPGQTSQVVVTSFVIADSDEEELWRRTRS